MTAAETLMAAALAEAERGLEVGAMPIGAVVAVDGEVAAGAYWRGDLEHGLLDHPELVALRAARRGGRAELFTTLEPCVMCMGAAMSFFASRVVYALESPLDGAARLAERWAPPAGHPRKDEPAAYRVPEVIGGVCRAEAEALVREWLRRNPSGAEAQWARGLIGETPP